MVPGIPLVHYNLGKVAGFSYTCMSAEIKRLKIIYHNKDEAFITWGYRNWRQYFRVHDESDCHRNYINQLMKALMKR